MCQAILNYHQDIRWTDQREPECGLLRRQRARTGGPADGWPVTKMAEGKMSEESMKEAMKTIGPEKMAAIQAKMSNMDPAEMYSLHSTLYTLHLTPDTLHPTP